MGSRRAALALAAILAATGAGAAAAHTPYLLPNSFDPERDHVTLEGALTEDNYFHPDIALKVQSYVEITPSGVRQTLTPAVVTKDLAVTEALLPDSGTYRFTTGEAVARRMKMAKVGERWLVVRPAGEGARGGPDRGGPARGDGEHASASDAARPVHTGGDGDGPHAIAEADLPTGAPTVEVENIITAETYVSKGAPTPAALKLSGHGFELEPVTHPNCIYVDQGFAFRFLADGKPAAGVAFTVYREGDEYDEKKITAQARTDADGRGRVGFERPGIYLLTASYPGVRAAGDAPSPRAYVYSLTFEVTR